MNKNCHKKKPTGPEPERLKLDGDWEDAAEQAMKKGKPPKGWEDQSVPPGDPDQGQKPKGEDD